MLKNGKRKAGTVYRVGVCVISRIQNIILFRNSDLTLENIYDVKNNKIFILFFLQIKCRKYNNSVSTHRCVRDRLVGCAAIFFNKQPTVNQLQPRDQAT